MSTVIRTCPGCKTVILSDTDQCPECGHVFYQRRSSDGAAMSTTDELKSAAIHEACPHCGEMVRAGLVRCWSCNGFMRADIAARYKDLTNNPQKIIYSTIPLEQRTDYLPARNDAAGGKQNNVEADEFTLSDDFNLSSVLDSAPSVSTAPAAPAPPPADGPDKPQQTTPGGTAPKTAGSTAPTGETATEKAESEKSDAAKTAKSEFLESRKKAAASDDDLLSIAMEEQREARKRRGERLAERQKKQMLVPCTCGTWLRVNDDMAGKTVRCRQCKQPIVIPEIKKKATDKKDEKAAPTLDVTWINDVWFHVLAPTSVVLKPGSLVGKHTEADLGLTATGLHIVAFTGGDKKKKSLLSFGSSDKKGDRQAHRQQVRDQVAATGQISNLPNCDLKVISADDMRDLRLVQPVVRVHESMFAGVPVFGEGRIAVYLPLIPEDGQQAFCSFPLTAWRSFSSKLKQLFSVELPGADNGIPETEKSDTLSCFVNQTKVESIRNLVYYQQDPAFELELSGFRCKACGVAISEEGRKKNKLGGANGKGIAKAKCPKCSGKMGEEPLYKIKKVAASDSSTES
ncbi:MAG: hypothetical protein JNM43_25700 [Planctomycetaceae bacterium]|nr:hypothetical protein [Planctomycetaceae bacterium]